MRYLISDIHGCYEEYMALLQKINFSDEDELFVLGDAMDRGPEPIRVIPSAVCSIKTDPIRCCIQEISAVTDLQEKDCSQF